MRRLQITLTEEATRRYLELISPRTKAEVNEDMEPSSPCFRIDMDMLGDQVYLEIGNEWVDVGEAESQFVGGK
jgi:hypothetical protein